MVTGARSFGCTRRRLCRCLAKGACPWNDVLCPVVSACSQPHASSDEKAASSSLSAGRRRGGFGIRPPAYDQRCTRRDRWRGRWSAQVGWLGALASRRGRGAVGAGSMAASAVFGGARLSASARPWRWRSGGPHPMMAMERSRPPPVDLVPQIIAADVKMDIALLKSSASRSRSGLRTESSATSLAATQRASFSVPRRSLARSSRPRTTTPQPEKFLPSDLGASGLGGGADLRSRTRSMACSAEPRWDPRRFRDEHVRHQPRAHGHRRR